MSGSKFLHLTPRALARRIQRRALGEMTMARRRPSPLPSRPTRGDDMAKVAPYHTNSPEHREVYHDHDDCPDGKRIKREHEEQGTGSKKPCKECRKLN
jgi:hypothetical protein